MSLSLESLQVLDAIDRKGSFAAAAEDLHRVPSAITYSVRQLEESLGIEIFDRTGHRAVLTEAGREVLSEGRKLLRAAAGTVCPVQPLTDAPILSYRAVSIADTSRLLAPRPVGLLSGQDTISVPSLEAKTAAQVAGLGVGFLPRWIAEREALAGRLRILAVEGPRQAA